MFTKRSGILGLPYQMKFLLTKTTAITFQSQPVWGGDDQLLGGSSSILQMEEI